MCPRPTNVLSLKATCFVKCEVSCFHYSKNDQSNDDHDQEYVFQQIKEESLTEPEVPVQNIADWTSVEDEVKEYKPLDKDEIRSHSNEQLLSMLTNVDAIEKEVLILDLLIKREGMKCVIGEGTESS